LNDLPWLSDACSLVDAFRGGAISPIEALEASLSAIAASDLNAVSFVDAERARSAAEMADVSLPFGGVPIGVKELEAVEGWPSNEGSLVFADRKADHTAIMVRRLEAAGAILAAQTTSSEFGGINVTNTRLHGPTGNPWNPERTPGGSSGGSAAAVAGGLLPIATGGDGGGSIRIPAGHTGMFGLKATYGRIPKGPRVHQFPHTVTLGCISRSVRDTARWFDVCNGYDSHDVLSLPRVDGWEDGLGAHREDLRGKRAVVSLDLGSAVLHPAVAQLVLDHAESLVADAGLARVDVAVTLPAPLFEWAMSNIVTLRDSLGDRYPDCEHELTFEVMLGINVAHHSYDLKMAAAAEGFRVQLNETMAALFDQADFVLSAVNPDVAFAAEGPVPLTVGNIDLIDHFGGDIVRAGANQGALTIPANLTGNPAVAIPIGTIDGLPVGLQVIGRHHEEPLLLELAFIAERERPWPRVAPGSPR